MTDPIQRYQRKPEYGKGFVCSTVLERETHEGVLLHMKMHNITSKSGAIHDLVRIALGLSPHR